MQNAQNPNNHVYFSVSQAYTDPNNPQCIPGQTNVQECLKLLKHCVGERVWTRCEYTHSHEAMVTGAYGSKAVFQLGPNRSTSADGTPFQRIKEEVTRGESSWGNPEITARRTQQIQVLIQHRELCRRELSEAQELENRKLPDPSPLTKENLFELRMALRDNDTMGRDQRDNRHMSQNP